LGIKFSTITNRNLLYYPESKKKVIEKMNTSKLLRELQLFIGSKLVKLLVFVKPILFFENMLRGLSNSVWPKTAGSILIPPGWQSWPGK
jgi:hypothetical protein